MIKRNRSNRGGVNLSPWLLTILGITAVTLDAQELAEEGANPEGEVYTLSPFQVDATKDVGYLSTNSTSGTSLNTALKDLPMSIQVINQEFITDLGATNLEEALAYSSGVDTENRATSSSVGSTRGGGSGDKSISSAASGDRFANVVYIRGLAVPFQNRFGFRYGGVVVTNDSAIALGGLMDSSNMERIEVVKGPNSLLYGVGVLTGIVNVIPERPLDEPRYEVKFSVGSDSFIRGSAEATGPIFTEGESAFPGQLNYRIVGAKESRDHWTDFRHEEVDYYGIQLSHRYKDKTRLLLEFQKGNDRQEGIGSQWIYDEVDSGNDTEFRNQWDENYNWARHSGEISRLRALDPNGYDPTVALSSGGASAPGLGLTNTAFVGGNKPDTYRITGPDTYAERDEWDFLADFELFPFEGFTLNAGVFITQQETEELSLDTGSYVTSNTSYFVNNEVQWDNQLNAIWNSGGVYGVPMQDSVEQSAGIIITPASGDWLLPGLNDDLKLTEYYWEKSLVKSKSFQARLRGTYTFDTDFFFGTKATHTFLAGFHYIKDDIDFPDGNIDSRNAESSALTQEAKSSDALYYRSITNFEPFYFDGRNDNVNGHNVVRAGDSYLNQKIEQEGYYGVYNGKFFQNKLEIIFGARRDIYNAEQLMYKRVDIADDELMSRALTSVETTVSQEVLPQFSGQGLTFEDIFNETSAVPQEALDLKHQLIQDRTANGEYISTYYRDQIEGVNAGYFDANRSGPVDQSYGIVPQSQRQLFADDFQVDTFTFGLNYDITNALTVYGVMSEGLTPNTSLRDGNGEIIPAERTSNKELGIKFDLMEGKLSGSVAVYEIKRENAIWNVPLAPAASKWYDAILEENRSRDWAIPNYDPSRVANYYVREEYFNQYFAEILGVDPSKLKFQGVGSTISQTLDRDSIPDSVAPTLRDKLILINSVNQQTKLPNGMIAGANLTQQFGGNKSVNNIGLNSEGLDDLFDVTLYNPDTGQFVTTQISSSAILYNAFMERTIDQTKNRFLSNNHPIRYNNFDGSQPQDNNTVDLPRSHGALVTFDETIQGIEMDLIWTVNDNLQMVFSYSHTEREADNTFNFTEWQSIADDSRPLVPPFTMLHREYGWAQAGIQPAWVDYSAYQAAQASGDLVSMDQLPAGSIEFIENPDETIPTSEMTSRNSAGQTLIFFDKRGNVINEGNSASAQDYDQILSGVSLNFNPQDEASIWGKYTFTEGALENLTINLGVKYVGEAETSVAFNSVSPLNELTVTPVVADYFKFDAALTYKWTWKDLDFRISLNVYNLLDHTYDVTTTTLGIDNPITGDPVNKRTERYYAPRSFRLGLTVNF